MPPSRTASPSNAVQERAAPTSLISTEWEWTRRAYTDTTVAVNTTYQYRVFAFNAVGNSLASNIATVVVPARPLAPTNLLLTVQGSLTVGPRIRVVFRDNQNGGNPETGFQVFRSDNGGAFALLTTLPPRAGVGNVTYLDYVLRPAAPTPITS